jgi:HAD superfamily hydrolase (TIGR01509 family)
MNQIKALIFDFDGLILDTETPRYNAWQETYLKHGCNLDVLEYAQIVGGDDQNFDFYKDLETKFGSTIDWDKVTPERMKRRYELLSQEQTLPGVAEIITQGKKLGFQIGLASSSPRSWIDERLPQTGLEACFDVITTIEETGKAKPDPALFLQTAVKLGIKPYETIVFEDSPNGCLAAKRAGMSCVVVTNRITRYLEFDRPDFRTASLAGVTIEEVLHQTAGL